MATTTQILAGGTTRTESTEFEVDSTPVTVIARVSSGSLLDSNAVGVIQRENSAAGWADVTWEDALGKQHEADFRNGSMERTLVAPGNYRVQRNLLTGRSGTPAVGFDICESA